MELILSTTFAYMCSECGGEIGDGATLRALGQRDEKIHMCSACIKDAHVALKSARKAIDASEKERHE